MGILSVLGLAPKQAKPAINLHPDCMTRHGGLVTLWLQGVKMEVFNPNTHAYEVCPNPIFDPALQYRAIAPVARDICAAPAPTPVERQVARQPVPPVAPPPPMPPLGVRLSVGDIWAAADGKKYLVVANKAQLINDYDPSNDPDSGEFVVMRCDHGVKPAVSCRNAIGMRSDGKYGLVTKVGTVSVIPPSGLQQNVPYRLCILKRDGARDVYLDSYTGEVKFQ